MVAPHEHTIETGLYGRISSISPVVCVRGAWIVEFFKTFKAILYVTCFVPETKNKTIEEVQLNFAPPGGSIGEGDSLMTGETSNPQSSSSASSTTGDSI